MNLGFGIDFTTLPPLRSGKRDPEGVTRLGKPGKKYWRATGSDRDLTPEVVGENVTFTVDGTRKKLCVHITRFEAGGPPFILHGFSVHDRILVDIRVDVRPFSCEIWER